MPLAMVVAKLRDAAARGLEGLTTHLGANLCLAPGLAQARDVAHGETADGLVRWSIVRGEQDSLIVRIATWATNLEGSRILVHAPARVGVCVLEPIGPGEVGAERIVSAAERRKMGDSAPAVSLEVVEKTDAAPEM
jgi:hypothetical protein